MESASLVSLVKKEKRKERAGASIRPDDTVSRRNYIRTRETHSATVTRDTMVEIFVLIFTRRRKWAKMKTHRRHPTAQQSPRASRWKIREMDDGRALFARRTSGGSRAESRRKWTVTRRKPEAIQ